MDRNAYVRGLTRGIGAGVLAVAMGMLGAAMTGTPAAQAYTKSLEPAECSGADDGGYGLAADCTLKAYDACSCWLWVFSPVGPGEEWGTVFDPDDCPGGCAGGGQLTDIWFASRCQTPPAPPRTIGGVSVHAVDALGCRTALLWSSGPLTITHCTASDQWTHIAVPSGAANLGGNPFSISITWGGIVSGGSPRYQLVSDNGIANLYCSQGTPGFPGCQTPACTCAGWAGMIPPQRSYVYLQDLNADGIPDDVCAAYGAPISLAFPLVAPYGYLPNNLLIRAGMSCSLPASVEGGIEVREGSWGQIKTLFE